MKNILFVIIIFLSKDLSAHAESSAHIHYLNELSFLALMFLIISTLYFLKPRRNNK